MADLSELSTGEIFAGFYEVERKLKSGGMGAVYIARHTETGRRHALKLMHPQIVANPGQRARFKQEAQIASIIDYPSHIVDVSHAGVDATTGMPFIVMELLIGEEVGELIARQGALPKEEVVDYLAQTARALDRAHARGVVHRDLKPDNLFVVRRDDEPPTVKILDFGIAKILQGTAVTQSTNAGGTPLYMAPEQTGKSSSIGPHTDVWALGLIAYTMLVGSPYWEPETIQQLFGEILMGDYEPPTARATRKEKVLPPEFDAWFLRCVCRDTTKRFPTAGEAIAALADALGVARNAISSTSGRTSPISSAGGASGGATTAGPATPPVPTIASGGAGPATGPSGARDELAKTEAAQNVVVSAQGGTADPVMVSGAQKRSMTLPIVAGVVIAAAIAGGVVFASRDRDKGASAAPSATAPPPTPSVDPSTDPSEPDSVAQARDRIAQAGWKITSETPAPAAAGCAEVKFSVEKGDVSGDVDHFDCDDAATAQAKASALASTNARTSDDVVVMVTIADADAAKELLDALAR